MAETIRTTVSLVYWTETAQEAATIAEGVMAALPAEDQDSIAVTSEIKPDGRPPAYASDAPDAADEGEAPS